MIEKDTTNYNLIGGQAEIQKDKVCKMSRKTEKEDNVMFQQDQKGFFRRLKEEEADEGEIPEMEKFVTFGEVLGKEKERTPNMPWM